MRIQGRATQGVKIIRLDEGEEIADVALIHDVVPEIVEDGENGVNENAETSENIVNAENTAVEDENTEGVQNDEKDMSENDVENDD